MSFRIRKVEKGYIVEKSKKKYGFTTWEPYVKSTGLNCAWHHSTFRGFVLLPKIQDQF